MSDSSLAWRKSSYSGTEGDNCVEVALSSHDAVGAVRVRDSKDVALPCLTASPEAWTSFVGRVVR
jgi:hypothetical protein